MKRKFYFIKDSVTGNYYAGANADSIVTFDEAAVYYQRKNAVKKIKRYISNRYGGSWPWYENCLKDPDFHWEDSSKLRRMIKERTGLPNWGIEIVEVEVEAP